MIRRTMKSSLVLILVLPALGAFARGGHGPAMSDVKERVSTTCPVDGKTISHTKSAAAKKTYKGTAYYFDSDECKAKFSKDPEKYIKHTGAAAPLSGRVSVVCSVDGKVMPHVKNAAVKEVYKGVAYYFDSAECKAKFDSDPTCYINQKQHSAAKP